MTRVVFINGFVNHQRHQILDPDWLSVMRQNHKTKDNTRF